MSRIKFCGLTREEDVTIAIDLAVDAVGFVLWPGSPRAVTAIHAARLAAMLPPSITPVGLFVRPTRGEIVEAAERVGIRVAQVHGMSDMSALTELPCELWVATSIAESASRPPDVMLLLDAHDPARHGGTGETIDWDLAGRIAGTRRVMLAGGLTPANVAEAIRRARPYGVDVSSGIEERPGVKSASKMRAFVRAVRGGRDD